jgi:hypothetical protein
MDDLINIVRSDTRLGGSRGNIQDFSRQSANLPHSVLALLIQDLDLCPPSEGSFAMWYAIPPIFWVWYRFRYNSSF